MSYAIALIVFIMLADYHCRYYAMAMPRYY